MEKGETRELLILLERARKDWLTPRFLEIGLTLGQGQARILKTLYKEEPMTQRELAGICKVDVTTMSRTLDRMAEKELLLRQPKPDCRRSFWIVLTPKGQLTAQRVITIFGELDEKIQKGFEEKEQQSLNTGLAKILDNFRE